MPDVNQLPNGNLIVDQDIDDTDHDPRHQKRIKLMQALFSYSFNQDEDLPTDELETYQKIVSLLSEIDPEIAKFAPERPLSEINRVDLAILRLVVYESKHTKVPTKVIINEAVELAKEFGTESSPRFVNGVLGQMLT